MDLQSAKTRSKATITLGFSAILVSFIVLLGLWVANVFKNEETLKEIGNAQLETRQISVMRNAALRRAIALHRMSIMDDPFDQEEEERRFRLLGGVFLTEREKVFSHPKMGQEKLAWDQVGTTLNKGGLAQNQVLEMILNEQLNEANKLLLHTVVPIQDIFVDQISVILDNQRKNVEDKLKEVTQRNQTTYWLIGLFGGVAFLLGIFTIYITRRTGKTEDALLEQGNRVRELYKVSAMAGLDIDAQINEMLALGCRLLKLEVAKVCRIDLKNNTNTYLYTRAPEEYGIEIGSIRPLSDTLCSITFSKNKPVAISNTASLKKSGMQPKESLQLASYIATTVSVHGKKYGTVNFSSQYLRDKNYTDTDEDLVNLIGSWVGLALERQFSQEELYAAKESAEAANKTKSTFLANMSHELRTPLNAIIGYSELLMEDIQDTENKQVETDLNNISTSGQHLLKLINDILDLSKVEAGKMQIFLQKTEISPLITDVIETFRPHLKKNQNELIIDSDKNLGYSLIDPTRFNQALMNLLSNAIKFTKNGVIRIKSEHINQENKDWVSIKVIDSGIGIAQNEMSHLFQPFGQANKETTYKYGGTGLGLALSRRMCRMMGGDITVESEIGKGSTFTILLPLSQDADASSET